MANNRSSTKRATPAEVRPEDLQVDSQVVKAAQEAAARIANKKDWEDWLILGRAFQAARTEILHKSGINAPTGARYSAIMHAWLELHGLDAIADKSARSALMECLENEAAITKWRDNLPAAKRAEWNHPTTVLRHYKSATRTGTRSQSARADKDRVILELQDELDEKVRELEAIRRMGGGEVDTRLVESQKLLTVVESELDDMRKKYTPYCFLASNPGNRGAEPNAHPPTYHETAEDAREAAAIAQEGYTWMITDIRDDRLIASSAPAKPAARKRRTTRAEAATA